MDVRVLGPIEVWAGTTQLDIGSRRERGLLALLAISAGEMITSDRLVEELWGESAPDRAVRSAVHARLASPTRGGQGPAVRRGNGYTLLLELGELDGERFAAALTDARRLLASDPVAAAHRIDDALGLWRGHPFEDLGDDVPTLAIEAERLVELRLSGIEDRIDARLATGDGTDDPVATIEALVAEHPLRERLWRALMLRSEEPLISDKSHCCQIRCRELASPEGRSSWRNVTSPLNAERLRRPPRSGPCSQTSRTWRATGMVSRARDSSAIKAKVWVPAAK